MAALAGAGLLWGTSVPLTKLALEWLPPAWLTVTRFGLAAVLLAAVGSRARAACSPAVLAWGAAGYGASILIQNAGITRTASATPPCSSAPPRCWSRWWRPSGSAGRPARWPGRASPCRSPASAWSRPRGGGATRAGDALVLVSLLFSAAFTVAQARLLPGATRWP